VLASPPWQAAEKLGFGLLRRTELTSATKMFRKIAKKIRYDGRTTFLWLQAVSAVKQAASRRSTQLSWEITPLVT
jgi:hypothetical protein